MCRGSNAIVSRPTLATLGCKCIAAECESEKNSRQSGASSGKPSACVPTAQYARWHVQLDSSNHSPLRIIPFCFRTMSIKVQEPSGMRGLRDKQGNTLMHSPRGLFSQEGAAGVRIRGDSERKSSVSAPGR
jgi:hypothetical protein